MRLSCSAFRGFCRAWRRHRNGIANSEATQFDDNAELPAVFEKRVQSSEQALYEKLGQGLPAEMADSLGYELEGSLYLLGYFMSGESGRVADKD